MVHAFKAWQALINEGLLLGFGPKFCRASGLPVAVRVNRNDVMSNVYRRFTGGRQSAVAPLLALVVVAMLWGGSFVVVKSAVAEIPPATLVAWRFTIATVVVLLGKPRCLCGVRARSALRAVALGALFGAGFLLQSWGMQSTRAVFSAFIAGSAVVMVPVIAWLWFNRRMNASTGWAVALTTVGLR